MFSTLFWRDALERSISTAVQVLLGLLTADGVDLLSLDWKTAGTVVGTAFVVSLLKAAVAEVSVKSAISPASLVKE